MATAGARGAGVTFSGDGWRYLGTLPASRAAGGRMARCRQPERGKQVHWLIGRDHARRAGARRTQSRGCGGEAPVKAIAADVAHDVAEGA
jgi:hypothetical protein